MAKPFLTEKELQTIMDYKGEMETVAAAPSTTPRVATLYRKMLRLIDNMLMQKDVQDTVTKSKDARKEAMKRQSAARLKAKIALLQSQESQGKPK